MITLKEIVSSNLEMLKEQEASLLKSLEFIQKAQQLFESQSDGIKKKQREKTKKKAKKNSPVKVRKQASKKKAPRGSRGGVNRLSQIMEILQAKKAPISSGELLNELFSKQTTDKDKKHFRTLFYPILTKAYKTGALKLKNKKIYLGSIGKQE